MESLIAAAAAAVVGVGVLFLLLAAARKFTGGGGNENSNLKLNLPPGPWQLPVIGSLHHLAAGGRLPHQSMHRLSQKYGPLMLLRLGEVPTLVVSSPEAAREVMKTHDISFATRPQTSSVKIYSKGGEGIAMAPYGDHWRLARKICVLELLSNKRVQSFRTLREDEVGRLVAAVTSAAAEGTVNVSKIISAHVADAAVRATVGESLKGKDRDYFLRLLDDALKLASGFNLIDLFPSSATLVALIDRSGKKVEIQKKLIFDFIDRVITEHQLRKSEVNAGAGEDEEEDLLDVLLKIQRDGESALTTDTIKSIILDVFAGGSETSSTTLQWAMAELLNNPAAMAKAQEEVRRERSVTEEGLKELKYLSMVIKETLRLHPPAPLLLPRECRAAMKVMGYDVPKGTMVLVNFWAIARDPASWTEDAGEFRPERFEDGKVDFKGTDFEFIPFGAGRRMCPGMAFGLANMELALASLLFYFDWELPDGVVAGELDMTEEFGVAVRRRDDLLARAVRRR